MIAAVVITKIFNSLLVVAGMHLTVCIAVRLLGWS